MLSYVLLGVFISVVLFGEPVMGDPTAVITMSSTTIKQTDCGYLGTVAVDTIQTKKSSQLTVNFPVTNELPPTMMMSFNIYLNGPKSEPLAYNISMCDAWSDPYIGQSFVAKGTPKETFPKSCPIGPGPWVVSKWDPPTDLIPPGFPPGPLTGNIIFWINGGQTCVTVDFVGELKRALPGIGR